MKIINKLKWSSVGVTFRYILQTIALLLLTRLLTPTDFGVVASITIVTTLITVIAQGGAVQIIATSNIKNVNNNFYSCFAFSTIVSTLFITLLLLFESQIQTFFNINNKLAYYLVVSSVLFKSLSATLEGYHTYLSDFKLQAKNDIISYFSGYFIVSISLGYLGYGALSLAYGVLIQSLVSFLLYLKVTDFNVIRKGKPIIDFRSVFSRAKYILFGQIVSNMSSQVDNLIVNKYLGVIDLGLYSRAYQLMVVPCNFIGQIVSKVFLNHFSRTREPSAVLLKSISFAFFASIFVEFFIVLFGDYLVSTIFGDEWLSIVEVLIILSMSVFPRLIYKISEPVLISNGAEKKLSFYVFVYFISTLTLSLLLVRYGVIGVSFAATLSTWIYGGVSFYNLGRVIDRFNKAYVYIFLALVINICILIRFL